MKKIVFLAVAVFAFAAFAGEDNLLQNADFTRLAGRNPAQWQCVFPAGSFRIVTLDDGSKFMQFGQGKESQQCMLIQRNLPLEAGRKYLFSCEVQLASPGASAMIYAEWRTPGADGKMIHASVNARSFTPTEEWQTIAFEIPVRADGSEKPYLVISVPAGKINLRNLTLLGDE